MIIASIVIIVILFLLMEKFKNKRTYELLKQFPSYPTFPLIGNLLLLRGSTEDVLAKGEKLMAPYDRLVFWLGPIPCLVLKKYDDIMAILNQNQHRETMKFLNEWVGMGILNAEYPEWKKSRRILAPAFSSEMLAKYTDVFNEKASNLVNNLKPAADRGAIIDAWDYVIHANVDSILGTKIEYTRGYDTKNWKDAKNYCEAILEIFENIAKRIISPWLHPHLFYLVYLKITGRSEVIDHLYDLPTKVMTDKLNNFRNSSKVSQDEDISSKVMIDFLIQKGSKDASFTEKRIKDEIIQLIGTGTETTALNVCFTLLMLAINQDIQQKVYEEIAQVMPENDTLAADLAINHLKYLEQCIKETSRMYSQAVLAFRKTHKDCLLSDDKIVPKNTFVITILHFVHHDPNLYANPSTWDPEHFNEQAVAKRPKGSELIFGYGPRLCIGYKYSIISSKIQIAHILRNYHLTTNMKEFSKDNLKADLCIRSKIGYPIKFTRRQITR